MLKIFLSHFGAFAISLNEARPIWRFRTLFGTDINGDLIDSSQTNDRGFCPDLQRAFGAPVSLVKVGVWQSMWFLWLDINLVPFRSVFNRQSSQRFKILSNFRWNSVSNPSNWCSWPSFLPGSATAVWASERAGKLSAREDIMWYRFTYDRAQRSMYRITWESFTAKWWSFSVHAFVVSPTCTSWNHDRW